MKKNENDEQEIASPPFLRVSMENVLLRRDFSLFHECLFIDKLPFADL